VVATCPHYNPVMLLAGDVGGTKTLLGLFEPDARRPQPVATFTYPTNAFESFTAILDAFARDVQRPFTVDAAALGVAGPVVGTRARLTNISWDISAHEITSRLAVTRVALLNDLEAMATSVEALTDDELVVLHEGTPRLDGNAAVIAAGTGLGQAYLHRVAMHGGDTRDSTTRLLALPSEGGHADFAARTDRELEFVRMLRELYGRAEIEQVLSGPGLLNLHRFTHRGGECEMLEGAEDKAARVSQAGLSGRCQQCVEALRMFVSAYGAEAGNLALRGVATAGLYVGGGIAPKILPMIRSHLFMDAFLAKAPMNELIARIPVKVILNADAGLLGAAVHAQQLAAAT
jgi:glucokinase